MKLNANGFGITWIVLILAVVVALGIAGYRTYSSRTDNPSHPVTEQHTENPVEQKKEKKANGTIITTGDSEFGTMLFDNKKQAIYIWEVEDSAKAQCYDDCAKLWPPVLTDGTPRAAGSVNDKLLGTTKRKDGSTQVTYNGHPLYYYAHEGPGEVECHNISTHGGLWWVIQPSGTRAD